MISSNTQEVEVTLGKSFLSASFSSDGGDISCANGCSAFSFAAPSAISSTSSAEALLAHAMAAAHSAEKGRSSFAGGPERKRESVNLQKNAGKSVKNVFQEKIASVMTKLGMRRKNDKIRLEEDYSRDWILRSASVMVRNLHSSKDGIAAAIYYLRHLMFSLTLAEEGGLRSGLHRRRKRTIQKEVVNTAAKVFKADLRNCDGRFSIEWLVSVFESSSPPLSRLRPLRLLAGLANAMSREAASELARRGSATSIAEEKSGLSEGIFRAVGAAELCFRRCLGEERGRRIAGRCLRPSYSALSSVGGMRGKKTSSELGGQKNWRKFLNGKEEEGRGIDGCLGFQQIRGKSEANPERQRLETVLQDLLEGGGDIVRWGEAIHFMSRAFLPTSSTTKENNFRALTRSFYDALLLLLSRGPSEASNDGDVDDKGAYANNQSLALPSSSPSKSGAIFGWSRHGGGGIKSRVCCLETVARMALLNLDLGRAREILMMNKDCRMWRWAVVVDCLAEASEEEGRVTGETAMKALLLEEEKDNSDTYAPPPAFLAHGRGEELRRMRNEMFCLSQILPPSASASFRCRLLYAEAFRRTMLYCVRDLKKMGEREEEQEEGDFGRNVSHELNNDTPSKDTNLQGISQSLQVKIEWAGMLLLMLKQRISSDGPEHQQKKQFQGLLKEMFGDFVLLRLHLKKRLEFEFLLGSIFDPLLDDKAERLRLVRAALKAGRTARVSSLDLGIPATPKDDALLDLVAELPRSEAAPTLKAIFVEDGSDYEDGELLKKLRSKFGALWSVVSTGRPNEHSSVEEGGGKRCRTAERFRQEFLREWGECLRSLQSEEGELLMEQSRRYINEDEGGGGEAEATDPPPPPARVSFVPDEIEAGGEDRKGTRRSRRGRGRKRKGSCSGGPWWTRTRRSLSEPGGGVQKEDEDVGLLRSRSSRELRRRFFSPLRNAKEDGETIELEVLPYWSKIFLGKSGRRQNTVREGGVLSSNPELKATFERLLRWAEGEEEEKDGGNGDFSITMQDIDDILEQTLGRKDVLLPRGIAAHGNIDIPLKQNVRCSEEEGREQANEFRPNEEESKAYLPLSAEEEEQDKGEGGGAEQAAVGRASSSLVMEERPLSTINEVTENTFSSLVMSKEHKEEESEENNYKVLSVVQPPVPAPRKRPGNAKRGSPKEKVKTQREEREGGKEEGEEGNNNNGGGGERPPGFLSSAAGGGGGEWGGGQKAEEEEEKGKESAMEEEGGGGNSSRDRYLLASSASSSSDGSDRGQSKKERRRRRIPPFNCNPTPPKADDDKRPKPPPLHSSSLPMGGEEEEWLAAVPRLTDLRMRRKERMMQVKALSNTICFFSKLTICAIPYFTFLPPFLRRTTLPIYRHPP